LPPTPRTLAFDFRETRLGTLADAAGAGTGFTHRLPGTGSALGPNDPNLRLIPGSGRLEITATGSDLNTRFRLELAEFPGVRLSDLGFTGAEDFEVAVKVADIPAMAFVGQFGIYAGVAGDWAVRGGLVSQREPESYRQFVVNTRDGRDKDAFFVGLGMPGDDLRMRLSRVGGKFSMSVENLTSGATSSLAIRHPEFLDGRADIVVGVFACDPRGKNHKPVRFGEFTATVWVPPSDR
jgi:regulation of enolase protein 1 (concanavalin A-like superfamily)